MTPEVETLFESAESPDGHRIEWSSSIDNLEKLLAEKRA